MLEHLNIKIYGQVQGVGFRFGVQKEAESLGLAGYVKNELGGSVNIEVEGEEKPLQEFIDWCKKGSVWSKVEKVEASRGKMENFISFEII